MNFPYVTALTAGVIIILQIILAMRVSGVRGQKKVGVGDGGDQEMLRPMRRHGNLAENSGIYIAGLALLELSGSLSLLLVGLCFAFMLVRVVHAIGLSQTNTMNAFRLMGGAGTYLIGFTLGGALIWVSLVSSHIFG